jgi:hypothetical protein
VTTRRRILTVLLTALAVVAAMATLLVGLFGGAGAAALTVGAVVAAFWYRAWLGPWHRTWGATAAEAAAVLPGDELLDTRLQTTRAIAVPAPPEALWPWLVQIGWGRAGWYSYDAIDNDGRPSAERIVPALQHLTVGDEILMMPGAGFRVRTVEPRATILSQAPDGTTWCLRLEPAAGDRCRLVSRFRVPAPRGVAARAWTAIADPGAFVMERRMLLGIRRRVERHAADRQAPTVR